MFGNLEEFRSSKTETVGSNQQISPGTFPILVTLREEPFMKYRANSSAKLQTKEDKIEEAKKQKTHEK